MVSGSETEGTLRMDATTNGDWTVQRLYGPQGAEELFWTPEEAYESAIEPFYEPAPDLRIELVEHDVHPPTYHLPTVDHLLEWVAEWTRDLGEVTEGYDDHMQLALGQEDVLAAAANLIGTIANRIPYRMAKDELRSLWVTFDGEEPLLDGVPMYGPAQPNGSSETTP